MPLVTRMSGRRPWAPGRTLEAAVEAREQGLARFIGVTGHGWTIAAMHKRALQRFDFDSVLMPYNHLMHQNEIYRKDFETVVGICRERNVAVQTIKSIARGPWGIHPHNRNPWYQPLEDQADIDRAVHWVLGHQYVFLNTVGMWTLCPKSWMRPVASRGVRPQKKWMKWPKGIRCPPFLDLVLSFPIKFFAPHILSHALSNGSLWGRVEALK